MTKIKVLGIQGSPRHKGNSEILLDESLKGAVAAGVKIRKINVYDLDFSGCLECNDCYKTGRCSISDDMDIIYDAIELADRIIVSAPMFFMSIPAHAKAMVDRCQRYWALKFVLKKTFPRSPDSPARYGAYIGVGGTRGDSLFDGTVLTMRYFFYAIDVKPIEDHYVFVRGVDAQGHVKQRVDSLAAAYDLGKYIACLG